MARVSKKTQREKERERERVRFLTNSGCIFTDAMIRVDIDCDSVLREALNYFMKVLYWPALAVIVGA